LSAPYQEVENRFVYSPSVHRSTGHHRCSRRMAPAVAPPEISLGINSRLLEFAIRHQMSARGVDVTKCELLSLQVAERMNRRVSARNEDRVIMQVRGTLDERNDSILVVSPDIHQRPQAREIVRAICKVGNGLFIGAGSLDFYRLSHARATRATDASSTNISSTIRRFSSSAKCRRLVRCLRFSVSVHHFSKWTLIARVHFESMTSHSIAVQRATTRRLRSCC